MESLSDEELISQFRAQGCQVGDKRIDTLFERHYQRVSLWCLRFTGNRDAAADLAQEIFLNVHRHLESFRGDAKFSTWLYTITRNQCRNKWRSGQSKPEEPMEPIIEASAVDSAPDAHTLLETSPEASRMRQLMQDALEPTEKRVMTLHYVDEMALESITRLLGLTNPSGAKAYVVSARRKLIAAAARSKGGPNVHK